MESQRSFLLIGLAMVSFLLWQQWQVDYGPQPVQPVESQQTTGSDAPSGNGDVPIATPNNQNALPSQSVAGKVISVTTDTLQLSINTVGGDVISANLLKYPLEQGSEGTYSLLRPSGPTIFVAQSGLVGTNGIDKTARPTYSVAQTA